MPIINADCMPSGLRCDFAWIISFFCRLFPKPRPDAAGCGRVPQMGAAAGCGLRRFCQQTGAAELTFFHIVPKFVSKWPEMVL